MTADMSDDDDDSDDERDPRSNAKQQQQQGGRQAALLAATSENNNNSRSINAKSPPPIAAPRPGYPAPIAALNLARPPPAASPPSPQGRQHPAQPNPFDPPMQNPFDDSNSHNHNPMSRSPVTPNFNFEFADSGPRRQPPGIQIPNNARNVPPPPASPRMPNTPHPLLPPMTPITPAFVRPTPGPPTDRDVKFHAEAIIRSDHEGSLLPKRGERGDDFWRRFSMIAKVENEKQTTEKQRCVLVVIPLSFSLFTLLPAFTFPFTSFAFPYFNTNLIPTFLYSQSLAPQDPVGHEPALAVGLRPRHRAAHPHRRRHRARGVRLAQGRRLDARAADGVRRGSERGECPGCGGQEGGEPDCAEQLPCPADEDAG